MALRPGCLRPGCRPQGCPRRALACTEPRPQGCPLPWACAPLPGCRPQVSHRIPSLPFPLPASLELTKGTRSLFICQSLCQLLLNPPSLSRTSPLSAPTPSPPLLLDSLLPHPWLDALLLKSFLPPPAPFFPFEFAFRLGVLHLSLVIAPPSINSPAQPISICRSSSYVAPPFFLSIASSSHAVPLDVFSCITLCPRKSC